MFYKLWLLGLLICTQAICTSSSKIEAELLFEDDSSIKNALKVAEAIEDESIDDLDPEEVAKILKQMIAEMIEIKKQLAQQKATIKNTQDDDVPAEGEIDLKFEHGIPASIEAKLASRTQNCMSDSSTDNNAVYSGIVYLNAHTNLASKNKTKLDQMYFLGLLYFNLHYQDSEEFQMVHLYMATTTLIKFYNLSFRTSYRNTTRMAKALIRAAYGAYATGEKALAKKILATYQEKYKSHRPSDIERNFLKRIKF